jgi:tetratricopeptide (TPR) repeat protein
MLYEQRVSELAHAGRPNAALAHLKSFEALHAEALSVFEKPVGPDLASAYAVMGWGLVSLGDLTGAYSYLRRSLALRENRESLEYLGLITLRKNDPNKAITYFERALRLQGEGPLELFNSLELRRLLSEAQSAAGATEQATSNQKKTQQGWLDFLKAYNLPAAFEAQALIELGKVEFHLGQTDQAIKRFFKALEKAPNNSSNHADVVAFLVNRHMLEQARDVYLDALGNREISQYYKIYMSMWVVAEAQRRGTPPDPHAMDYLNAQEPGQWSTELARYVSGQGERATLEKMATTRGRRAELLFYSAVLGPESKSAEQARTLLEEVLRGDMVLFFEYEMAIIRLRELEQ